MKPVFERFFAFHQGVDVPGLEVRYAGPEGMVVGARDHRDRVDLYGAEPLQRTERAGSAAAENRGPCEALTGQRQAA